MTTVSSQLLHQILEYAGRDNFKAELELCKQKFFNAVGVPGESAPTTESELANFIEWFVFDWPLPGGVKLWEKFLKEESAGLDAIALETLKSFASQNYSLFQLKKTRSAAATVRELVSGRKLKEAYGLPSALQIGELFLGRVIEVAGQFFFTEALFYLPRSLAPYLERGSKLVRKNKLDRGNFLEELKIISIKAARYPRMKLEEIYK